VPFPGLARSLRIAALGKAVAAEWTAVTGGRGVVIEGVEGADGLLDPTRDLAVASTTPQEASRVASLAAGQPHPAVALFLDGPTAPHPVIALLAALVLAKREWEQAFDAIVDAVAIVDGRGVVGRANLALARLTGRAVDEVIGLDRRELLGEVAEDVDDPIAEGLSSGRSLVREVRFARLPGVYQVTVSPFASDGAGEQGAVVVLKDVTTLRDQQARLEMTHRLADVGRLAGGVAHEISTPLASIALRAESLLRKAGDETLQAAAGFKDFPRYLKTIEEETFRCKRIIGALLEFSRSRRPEVAPTDINGLVERAVGLVSDQARAKRVTLGFRPGPNVPYVAVDAGQLREALIALLLNALDATLPGGHVEVLTAASPGGGVALSVADDGVGIAPEHLEKIFVPFFTTKPVGQATGLGLSICDGIVKAHGAQIRVESRPGEGARFTIELPAGRAARSGAASGDS
jgi:PAS domain S-box-containing protein